MQTRIYQGNTNKILYVMRGLPGSGKTTTARTLSSHVYATDDFFMHDGMYVFDASNIKAAHRWNIARVQDAVIHGETPVVVDNTNVEPGDMRPYVQIAMDYDYTIILVEPDTSWAFDVDELTKRTVHHVPMGTITRRLACYQKDITLDDILAGEADV